MLSRATIILLNDTIMALLAIISAIGNGFLLLIILMNKNLRKNSSLYLLFALSAADFLCALLSIPYITFLIVGWNQNANFTYSAKPMLLFNLPIAFEIKFGPILTVAIAFDRFSALQWPISYKLKQQSYYIAGALLIGTLWAAFDITWHLTSASFTANPGCAAAGCFANGKFLSYSSVSNMSINAFSMAVTVLVYFKIKSFKAHSRTAVLSNNNSSGSENAKTVNANRLVLSVLLCSGVCVFLPATISGLSVVTGLPVFAAVGPFVALGLLASGVGNAFIIGTRHNLIRQAIRSIWKKDTDQQPRSFRSVQNRVHTINIPTQRGTAVSIQN